MVAIRVSQCIFSSRVHQSMWFPIYEGYSVQSSKKINLNMVPRRVNQCMATQEGFQCMVLRRFGSYRTCMVPRRVNQCWVLRGINHCGVR
jgi:hypothetical protein